MKLKNKDRGDFIPTTPDKRTRAWPRFFARALLALLIFGQAFFKKLVGVVNAHGFNLLKVFIFSW